MKVIVAGCRDYNDVGFVLNAMIESKFDIDIILQGGANGVDMCAKIIAIEADLPCLEYPADWDKHGKAAGPIRNREMAGNADALVAVWDGMSLGTKNMIDTARDFNLKIFIKYIDTTDKRHYNS
jgi:predicted Rossmann fold nucleotide-binding protein DprA/Smf involved in DNA uptake